MLRKLSALFCVAVMTVGMIGCGAAESTVDSATDAANSAAETVGDAAEKAADQAAETVSDAADSAADAVESATSGN